MNKNDKIPPMNQTPEHTCIRMGATPWKRLLLLCLSCFFLRFALAQTSYFPPLTGTWETISPSTLGWCNENIDSLYQYLNQKNTKAFIVLKDGKIVLEKYFGNFTQDSLWYWASAGKTLTAFSMGLAQQDGYLKIQESSNKYLGKGWSSLTTSQEDSVTIRHHLTMTTGLNDAGADPDCTLPSCLTFKASAGTRWAYHNAPYTLLDKVIESATGGNLNVYITKKFTTKIGMKGLFVKSGYLNVYFSTARSMARFGILLLNKGVWDGTVILSDTQYFRQQINSSQNINPSYGYLTWLNGKSSFMAPGSQIKFNGSLNPDAPNDMFCAWGKNGQYINVVPSQKLILIRMGNAPGGSGSSSMAVGFNNEIWQYVNRLPCTSRIENLENSGMAIFPNPTQSGSLLKIQIHESQFSQPEILWRISLTDPLGREIKAIDTNNPNHFPIPENLNSGVYQLRISNNLQFHRSERLMIFN